MFETLDWKNVLNQIKSFATSEGGKAEIEETTSLKNSDIAIQSFREIEDMKRIIASGLRPHFKSLDLFNLWFDRLVKKATLKTLEFRDVRHFCIEIIAFDESLSQAGSTDFLLSLKNSLPDAHKPLSAIDQILSPDGEIRTDASETLYHLFREKQEKEREVRVTLDKLVKSHQLDGILQEKYVTTREGRWVLPIRSGMRHDLEGIIHDMSQTKQTVYMEPQPAVQINNHLRTIESKIQEEIERLLRELSQYLSGLTDEFLNAKSSMSKADVRLAQAQFAIAVEAHPPDFSEDIFRIKEIRHPLLSLQLGPNKVISNTVRLDSNGHVLVLSGPNAGGKTVLLKSIGLAAQMARCGLPICAEPGSQIPFFEKLLSAIGDSQSVDQHLSTFAAHLKQLSEALTLSGFKHLVLIDEICGSTDPEEGSALARSFIEAFAKNKIFAIITSHLGPLKSGWEPDSQVLVGSMDFEEKSSQPTYQLVMGVSGRSLAIKTARKVGVPLNIVERALDLIGPEAKKREELLTQLEDERHEMLKTKNMYQQLVNEAKETKRKYYELVEKFRNQRDQWMIKTKDQAEKKLNLLFEEIKRDQLKTKSVYDFKAQLPQVIKTPQAVTIETVEDFARIYPAGSAVFVKSLNQDGVIQGTPNGKGEIPVLSNSMRLFVHWTGLSSPRTPNNPTPVLARKSGLVQLSIQTEDREIDLRGFRVEEALGHLETELDTAVRNKEERVRVIHGHGTEVLKKAVRGYFSRSVYVKKWKAGDPNTGGDGITWLELAD